MRLEKRKKNRKDAEAVSQTAEVMAIRAGSPEDITLSATFGECSGIDFLINIGACITISGCPFGDRVTGEQQEPRPWQVQDSSSYHYYSRMGIRFRRTPRDNSPLHDSSP